MSKLFGLAVMVEALTTRWHTTRTLNKAANILRDAIIRYPTRKRSRYKKGKITVGITENGKLFAKISDKVANIIEHGFKTYHWGRKVLNNPKNKILGQYPNRYMRVKIKDKLLQKEVLRTVSEKAINKKPDLWRMPGREGEWYLKNTLARKKPQIRKMIATSLQKDIINFLKK